MFKNIFSKVQAFGKAVFTRIVGFIGGVIGIKPETVEVPAPPEIANDSLNNAPEKAKTEEEKGLTKAYTAVKKATSAAIKAVKQGLIASAQLAYMVAHFAVPFQILSLAWEYAQAQGLVAIFMGLWNMGTLPYMILCILIAIGIGSLIVSVEALWSALLQPIRRFLFRRPVAQQQPVTVEPIQPEEDALYIISTVEKIIKRTEDRLDERLVAIETMLKYDAPQAIAALEKSETEEVNTVVDSSPAAVITTSVPVAIEITDETETDEIEETVDSSPVPPTNINHPLSMLFVLKDEQLTKELTELNMETLKKTIVALNSHVKAPQKVSSHSPKNAKKGEGKAILVNRIKQQIKMIRENNQMVAA